MTEPAKTTDATTFQMKGFGAFVFTMLVITGCVDGVNWLAHVLVG